MPDPLDHDAKDAAATAQRERAHRSWELIVTCGAGTLPASTVETLRKTLRIKRFELEAFLAGLPGPVRSGAYIDLEPIHEGLESLGVPCVLRRREGPEGASNKA